MRDPTVAHLCQEVLQGSLALLSPGCDKPQCKVWQNNHTIGFRNPFFSITHLKD
jgi:hypothetical protein